MSRRPHKKVAAAGISGSLATAIVVIAAAAGLDIGPEIAAAMATILSFAAGYIKRA